jgi:TolB protein
MLLDESLSRGLTGAPWLVALAVAAALAASANRGAGAEERVAEPLGPFADHGDVGKPALAGRATYNAASDEIRLAAAGVNMWGPRDELHFVWRKMKGDFILRARVELLGSGTNPHRKAGVIARASLEADAAYADAVVHGDGLTSLQYRRAPGGETEEIRAKTTGADVLQLERKGTVLTVSVARFGDLFETIRATDVPLGEDVYAGLFLCSHDPQVVEEAVFRDVRLVRPAPEGFVPYRDYIGSRLEILDVRTGRRQLLKTSKEPFEAPNWTRDGRALVYNTSGRSEGRGRLVRFDLATRESSLVDTGSCTRNNNDHVLSFDGSQIGISDQSADGESAVYVLPASGGAPRRVTPKTPSYLHGWSPDGQYLVYTGGRSDEFDIYRMRSDGRGDEVRLTEHEGLDDGPEYSPDGRDVYFNSTRSGAMQIWRMKPDGTDPERVTQDDLNNWFPHLSPDGKWIAFITFPKEVDPSDHPYYKRVYLRLMPAAGGEPRVIAYVYGGQGTMNVPSWSPDGTMLAFVSNTDVVE